ncbi:MAG: L-aspartate oxidase [Thermoguttaceae bacterium]|jgi:L-aspartate oxidase
MNSLEIPALRKDFSLTRYLIPFHAKRQPHFFTDVLIIGGGLAGIRAALAVDPSLRVLVVCKDGLTNSNSVKAQGGVATVWDFSDDNYELHIRDTLIAGGALCDESVVRYIVEHGTEEVKKLIEYGTRFDKKPDGSLLFGREGGHSRFRILHADGDATGREVMRAMTETVKTRPNIRIWDDTYALDLLTADGSCRGAVVHWTSGNETELIWAKQTILATGGIGQLYRETTNPAVACGDGIAMAYRAGATIRDMEFVQFHPTVLYIAGSSRSLITEAMRGEGAYLVDRNGYRFMKDYDQRMELAPRDVVSRSIVDFMIKTNQENVWLDLRYKDSDWVYHRFPGIAATCRQFGIDIANDLIPVRPGAHYSMGGILIDSDGRTTLEGLWAAGEVSSSGLHGANRLASNSLLEAMVYGETVGRLAGKIASQMSDEYRALPIRNNPVVVTGEVSDIDLDDIRNALKSVMWRKVGVVRDEAGLSEALASVCYWSRYVLPRQFRNPKGWELQNMLTVARLIIEGALGRRETRGSHNRSDWPETHDLAEHTLIVRPHGDSEHIL